MRYILNFLKKLKVKNKLLLVFGLMILFIIIFGSFNLFELNSLQEKVNNYNLAAKETAKTRELQRGISQIKEFLVQGMYNQQMREQVE